MQLRYLTLAVAGLCAASACPQAAPHGVDNQPASVAIVELFTSEGCSSCPPADALLRQIHLKNSGAGQLIVGLSEHVTYWNSLGWRDPYSQQLFTDRQNAYATKLALDSTYTPQMVVNGRDQFVGSDGHALQQALRADAQRKHAELKIVAFTREADGLQVTFSLAGVRGKPMDIVAVLTDDMDSSNVLRGENSGRVLQHTSVARSLTQLTSVTGDTQRSMRLALPTAFQHADGKGHHLVLFAQEPHQGQIIGAAAISL